MFLCIGATPAVQRVMVFRALKLDAVNRAGMTLEGAAGKSVNVAKALHALGEHPVAVGFLGGIRGERLRHMLEGKGLELDFVTTDVPTRECVTVIDESTRQITELVEESCSVLAADYEQLYETVTRQAPRARALVLSGTLTPSGPTDFYLRCVELAHRAGAVAVVDAQGAPLLEALRGKPGLVKPNRTELAATTGLELRQEIDVIAAIHVLHEKGAQRVVVTGGQEPALAFDGSNVWRIRPPEIEAVNPIGSGDAFTAALVSRLVRGDDLGEACRWGAAAGAANALTYLPGEVELAEVTRLLALVKVERVPGKRV